MRDKLLKDEQEKITAENKPYIDALKEDFEKLKKEAKKGCKEFLAFVNDAYAPEGKRINLTEESLKEN